MLLMNFICKALFYESQAKQRKVFRYMGDEMKKEERRKGSPNNGISLKYNCKHAKICATKFMISTLISSTMKTSSLSDALLATSHPCDARRRSDGTSKRSHFIDQMFAHSWISAASLHWNLSEASFIFFSRMGFLRSFQLSPAPSSVRTRECENFAEFHRSKNYLY